MLYNSLFNFLNQNDFISPVQSGFKPGDSSIDQFISITHEIYYTESYEIGGVFLDISKAFDKVLHEGLVFKLKQNGISGNLLNIFEDFLRNRKQKVVLNEQTWNWEIIHADVPQDSILGSLFSLIYINDLAENLSSNPSFKSTSLFSIVRDLNTSANKTSGDLKKIEAWAHQWKKILNPNLLKQLQQVIFSRKRNKVHHPDIISSINLILFPTASCKKALTKNVWVCVLMVSLNLKNILKEYLIKLVKLLVLFASSEIATISSANL